MCTIPCDVTSNESVKEVVEHAVRECGRVDCFFNNAGIQGELCPLYTQAVRRVVQTYDRGQSSRCVPRDEVRWASDGQCWSGWSHC